MRYSHLCLGIRSRSARCYEHSMYLSRVNQRDQRTICQVRVRSRNRIRVFMPVGEVIREMEGGSGQLIRWSMLRVHERLRRPFPSPLNRHIVQHRIQPERSSIAGLYQDDRATVGTPMECSQEIWRVVCLILGALTVQTYPWLSP